jgi:hypothetical protein
MKYNYIGNCVGPQERPRLWIARFDDVFLETVRQISTLARNHTLLRAERWLSSIPGCVFEAGNCISDMSGLTWHPNAHDREQTDETDMKTPPSVTLMAYNDGTWVFSFPVLEAFGDAESNIFDLRTFE